MNALNHIALFIGLSAIVSGGLLGGVASFTTSPTMAKARGSLAVVFVLAGGAWLLVYLALSAIVEVLW